LKSLPPKPEYALVKTLVRQICEKEDEIRVLRSITDKVDRIKRLNKVQLLESQVNELWGDVRGAKTPSEKFEGERWISNRPRASDPAQILF